MQYKTWIEKIFMGKNDGGQVKEASTVKQATDFSLLSELGTLPGI